MSRIAPCFERLQAAGKKALIPYVVAGDPSLALTVPLMHALVEEGADILELGVPFSDPMAEGPVIQLGHERALTNGVSLTRVLDMVAEFRRSDSTTPVVVMGYANPVERMGYSAFAQAAAQAGVDALITVDVPPEEVDRLNDALAEVDIDSIFLIAPTTPPERIERIVGRAGGFIYYVSLKGVTGAGHIDTAEVAQRIEHIRGVCDLPIAVGFGIKDAASAAAVASVADGVVVGSALVDRVANAQRSGADTDQQLEQARHLVRDIRAGIDSIAS